MSVWRLSRWSLPVLVPALLVLALLAVNGPVGAVDGGTACTPFQESIKDGHTNLTAHGSTRFAHALSTQGDLGGGMLSWSVEAIITGANTGPSDGNISGFLNFTIDWDAASRPNSQFTSECVGVVHDSVGHLNEGTYSGYLEGFFPNCGTICAGLETTATLKLDRVDPKIADLDLQVVSGGYCESDSTGFFLHKNNSRAPGHKTGNGGRQALCVVGSTGPTGPPGPTGNP